MAMRASGGKTISRRGSLAVAPAMTVGSGHPAARSPYKSFLMRNRLWSPLSGRTLSAPPDGPLKPKPPLSWAHHPSEPRLASLILLTLAPHFAGANKLRAWPPSPEERMG